MNYNAIFKTVGKVVGLEALLMLIPVIVSAIYGEKSGWALLITCGIALALYGLSLFIKKSDKPVFAKEGLITATFAWVALSLIGALPFVISGEIPRIEDAIFETVSGFTTTGATILYGEQIEAMSKGLLFWRSLTHWIGGMGILVFVMAITSKNPDRSMNILKAEMPGPVIDKLVPKAKDTAKILYYIYIALTLILTILLLCGGMPLYDSIVHALGTAGTGGFGIKADSIAGYNHYLQWVIAIFMIIFGINFNLFFLIIIKRVADFFRSKELWIYISVVVTAIIIVMIGIYPLYNNFAEVLRLSTFQVSATISTTGYSICDETAWNSPLAKTVIVILMFVGGCAGSTAGGFKLSRIIILIKKILNEIKKVVHPRAATVVKFEGKRVDDSTLDGVGSYLAIYVALFVLIVLLLSIESSFSFEANFTAAASCFNNIGPIFDNVAGSGTFANYSVFSKIILTFAMLLGRLEIYPVVVALTPATYIKK